MKHSKGFTLVEGLLILLIAAILAATGWYVFQAHDNANQSLSSADKVNNTSVTSTAEPKTTTKTAADPTAGWKAYSDAQSLFSVKYPATWVTATNPGNCAAGILLLGANTSSVGTCGSENGGQINLSAVSGDNRQYVGLGSNYKDVVTKDITVDGVAGQRQSGTVSVAAGQNWQGPANGTAVVEYLFYTKGYTYTAIYTQASGYPDVLADFDMMVTQTLKF